MSESAQGKKKWLSRLVSRANFEKYSETGTPPGAINNVQSAPGVETQTQLGPRHAALAEPPPPYTPGPACPSASTDQPSSSEAGPLPVQPGPSSLVNGPHVPVYRELPPLPTYDEPALSPPVAQQQGKPAAQQTTTAQRTAKQDKKALQAILRSHGWRPLWGPQPLTLDKALSRSALVGNERLVRALLDVGATIYKPTPPGACSAMHEAVRGPEPGISLLLLDSGYASAFRSARASGLADEEAAAAAAEEVKRLLGAVDRNRCTPLHLAANAGVADLVEDFLYLGADADAVDVFGRTPLHMAARYQREEAMACLLDHGADASMIDEHLWRGLDPDMVAELGDWPFIKQRLEHACEEKERRDGLRMRTSDDTSTPGKEQEKVGECDVDGDHIPQATGKTLPSSGKQSWARATVGAERFSRRTAPGTPLSSDWYSLSQTGPKTAPLNIPATFLEPSKRPVRQLPPSVLLSPQFENWRRTCEVLQEEYRQQRERDRRAEIPSYDKGRGV